MAFVLGGIVLALTHGSMAAPTVIANNTGYSAACYDFNNYVAATDSPVIGGWVILTPASGDTRTRGGRHLFRGFGKVCTGTALSSATDFSQRYVGRLSYYSSAQEWYVAGTAYSDSCSGADGPCMTTWYPMAESLRPSCTSNAAPIRVSGYVRSDGGTDLRPVHGYDLTGTNTAWFNPGSYPAGTILDTWVCVKTDTY